MSIHARPSCLSFLVTAAAGLVVAGAAVAAGPVLYDESDLDTAGVNISAVVAANDFTLAADARIGSVQVWLRDETVNDNGALDDFSGALAYGLYTHDGSQSPPLGKPGTLLVSGAAQNLRLTDTGAQIENGFGGMVDVFTVGFDFEHPIEVAAGTTYWLALHEGVWGSGDDGSEVFWVRPAGLVGNYAHFGTAVAEPGSWTSLQFGETAFVLLGIPTAWHASGPAAGGDGIESSLAVTANNFVFPATTSFSSLDAWILDDTANDDGVVDNFSGVMGWAILADSGGKPGSEIASGTRAAVPAVDAGFQSGAASDVARVRVALDRTVTLDAGTYWLALHEGGWQAAGDDTSIFWADSPDPSGALLWQDSDPVSPGAWDSFSTYDSAFSLFEDPIFASGFEAGVACAWSVSLPRLCL